MSRFWNDRVRNLTPYVPGEQPRHANLVKLNTNESPYPPSPRVAEAIAGVGAQDLRRYPDPQSVRLREVAAKRVGLDIDQVFVGNGSDEVLAFAFMGLFQPQAPICYPDVSYSFYPVWAQLFGLATTEVALTDEYRIDVQAYPQSNGGVVIPNPNAPTGILLALDDIEQLLTRCADSVVIIDEAYIDFGGDSAVSLIDRYENLLVVQTLSKSRALAGLRVGLAFGNSALIEALDRVKNSFNSYPLDAVAQAAAQASMEDEEYFAQVCEQVVKDREALTGGLAALGFTVLPSAANFVFAAPASHSARDLFQALREQGIIVRYFDRPRLDNYLRISVGTPDQNQALLDALSSLVNATD
jgi:histidinol-phosphate aminotransferase